MDKKIKAIATIALLCACALILFFPVFIKWKGIFHNDQAMSEWIRHYFFAWNLQKGIIPLWDPHVYCGALPHYAFIFAGENYYLLTWPFMYLANVHNLDNAYWMICLLPLFMHYLIAVTGMFFLLKRVVRCNWIASMTGAVAYMYSPVFAYAYVSEDNLIMQAWLPWLLCVYAKTVEKFAFWKLCLGGLLFSCIWFGGKLQYMPFMLFIWAGFVIVVAMQNPKGKNTQSVTRPIGIAAVMFVLGTALSALYLLPVAEGLTHTRLHVDLNIASAITHKPGNMPLSYLVTLFLPGFFGSITGRHFIFERLLFWDANMSGGMMISFIVFLASATLLAIFPLFPQRNEHRKFIVLGLALYLFSVLCALGGNTPFYRIMIGWIPLVNGIPYPIRYRMIQCFAASLLIGTGIHYLTSCDALAIRKRLVTTAWLYIGISLAAMVLVLLWPQHEPIAAGWHTKLNVTVNDYFALHQPLGQYTPKTSRVKKIRVFFDGPSQGQLCYADTDAVPLNQGTIAKNYAVLQKGWAEFEVDIPPDKFLWIVPLSKEGRIGFWEENEDHCFRYDAAWRIIRRTGTINMYTQSHGGKTALLYRLIDGYVERGPVVTSFFYWAVFALCIGMGARLLSIKQFGYLAALVVMLEFFYFGTTAFYGCTFNEARTEARSFLPHNVRAKRPSEHPMIRQMREGVFPVIEPNMRIASEYPFYDNFVYLDHGFALMGEPPFPLETRFKRAIEAAYESPLDQSMFYEGGRRPPTTTRFLNNFSVKYFLSNSSQKVFPDEDCASVAGPPGEYIHINKEALPRAYAVATIVSANDSEALKALVLGDLKEAVYMDPQEGMPVAYATGQTDTFDFQGLQNKNRITGLDFSNPNEVTLNADITVPSILVLTDVWFPGWEAFDGNSRVKIYRVNYCQRGIWVDKGQHHLRLVFSPLPWRIGLSVSLVTAFSMGIFLIIKAIRHGG